MNWHTLCRKLTKKFQNLRGGDVNEFGNEKKPTLYVALIPIIFMVIALIIGIGIYESDPHIPLFSSAIVGTITALSSGYSWNTLEKGIIKGVSLSLQPF